MKRKIVLFIMALLCALPMFSETGESMDKKQTDANVYGHVIELKTGEHLAYVIVSVKGTTLSTTTDATGHYYMKNLPVGKYVIEVKAMGYRTVTREIETKMHQSQEVNFTLTEDAIALDEVVTAAGYGASYRIMVFLLLPFLVMATVKQRHRKAFGSMVLRCGTNVMCHVVPAFP